ncbi:hypothetical protein L7F22_057869 [Adiantum nelumboides]|nr:hypothetical protein [Adiantum nelumboides]
MATQAEQHNDYVHGRDAGTNGHHASYDMEANLPGPLPKAHRGTVSQVYDPSFFKIANPGPLGLISFALTTFVLGFYQCGRWTRQAVFGLAIFFGGGAQFVAGIFQFRVGNTFGCTVHCSYGAFRLSFAMFMIPSLGIREAYAGDDRAYTVAFGIYLIAWCLLTQIFLVAALQTNIAILLVLGCLSMAFFLLDIAQFISANHATAAVRVNRAVVPSPLSALCLPSTLAPRAS